MPSSIIQPEQNETLAAPAALIVGDAARAEMRPLIAWIQKRLPVLLKHVREPNAIDTAFADGGFPDLIVVLQGWSDEYSSDDIHQILSIAPLARVVVCYGSWCESDGRNRSNWPWSIRVPIWAAVSRIEREWQSIVNPDQFRPLPWSASREEVFVEDHGESVNDFVTQLTDNMAVRDTNAASLSFLVDSPDCDYARFLKELLTGKGYAEETSHPDLILFDADPWSERESKLQQIRTHVPQTELVILTNFISTSDIAKFQSIANCRVVHKLGLREQFAPSYIFSME